MILTCPECRATASYCDAEITDDTDNHDDDREYVQCHECGSLIETK